MKSLGSPLRQGGGQISHLLAAQVIVLTSSLIVTFATAGLLGPTGRGELSFVLTTANLLGGIAFGSLHVGVVQAHLAGDQRALHRGLRLGAFSSILVMLLTLLSVSVAHARGRPELIWPLILVAIGAAAVSIQLVIQRTRQALGDARACRTAAIVQAVTYVIAGLLAAKATHSSTIVVLAWLGGVAISTVYILRGYDRQTSLGDRAAVPTRSIVARSLSAHVGYMGNQVLYRADIVILAFAVPPSQLGIYSVAVPIAELPWVFSEALSLRAFSQIRPGMDYGQRTAQRRRLLLLNLLISTLAAVLVAIAVVIALPRILPDYGASVLVVLILLPGTIVGGSARIAFAAMVANGARRSSLIVGVAAVVLAATYVPFIYNLGIAGAAIASSLVYVLHATVVLWLAMRLDRRAMVYEP